jgi:hypothetical protein
MVSSFHSPEHLKPDLQSKMSKNTHLWVYNFLNRVLNFETIKASNYLFIL